MIKTVLSYCGMLRYLMCNEKQINVLISWLTWDVLFLWQLLFIIHFFSFTWRRCSYKPHSPCLDHNSLTDPNTYAAAKVVSIFKQCIYITVWGPWMWLFPSYNDGILLLSATVVLLLWQTDFQSSRSVIALLVTSMVDWFTFSKIVPFLLHHNPQNLITRRRFCCWEKFDSMLKTVSRKDIELSTEGLMIFHNFNQTSLATWQSRKQWISCSQWLLNKFLQGEIIRFYRIINSHL